MGSSYLNKYRERVKPIGATNAATALSVYNYNIKTVPVLAYVGQLCPLPSSFAQTERVAMQAVLKLATNALRHPDFYQLPAIGGPVLRSAEASAFSALFRAARVTITVWPSWLSQLKAAAMESLPLKRVSSGIFHPDFWDAPAFAVNLENASRGFMDHPRLGGNI